MRVGHFKQPIIRADLHRHGVLSLPDFIANAGGVICAAMEYAGASEATAFAMIEEKVRRNTSEVLARAAANSTTTSSSNCHSPMSQVYLEDAGGVWS